MALLGPLQLLLVAVLGGSDPPARAQVYPVACVALNIIESLIEDRFQNRTEYKKGMKTRPKFALILLAGVSIGMVAGLSGARMLQAQTKTLPGYVIAEVDVTDRAGMQEYGSKVPATLAPFNHQYLVRGGKIQTLEGDAPKGGIVIIAFDSVEKAREWYDSPAYSKIRPLRQRAADSRIFVAEGLPRE